ncbi:hypothetical protein [Methanococcus maripaludis]|uniref:Sec-independent protein translocase protein TatA n=2 Tax=Methanococcus maripaludis TaxID=39152 RepID=A0A7J9PLD2_METMI|nr:hypothetical protein [Methanococcus maripaludis]MBA2862309.1 Sec-independent protein translocase protein TatA [Methanococcus maripaludis]
MNPFKSKILFIIFIISFLSFSTAVAENINLENLNSDDTYVYNYFDEFLDSYENTINKMIQNNITYAKDSESKFKQIAKLDLEIQLHEEYGINTSAKSAIAPFYSFSENLNELSKLCLEMNKNLELNTTNSKYFAKITGLKILDKIDVMYDNLDDISNISELKKDDEILEFDTDAVEKSLKYLELKITNNVEKIGNITLSSNLTIFVSPENPIIYENVSIYGTGLNGKGKIIISGPQNKTENIVVTNNYYFKSYSFEKAGTYNLKLTQYGKESETIEINVSKIPTEIVMGDNFQFPILKENKLSGKVVDIYGNFVNSETIDFGNETLNIKNGIFEKIIYSNSERIENYSLKFYGTEEYLPSEKNISLNFSKRILDIKISTEMGKINLNDPCIVTGTFDESENNLNLNLWVNGEIVETFDSKNTFKKELFFEKSGIYEIYVTYEGNEFYRFSKSNILTVNVVDETDSHPIGGAFKKIKFNWKILLLAAVLIVFASKIPNLINNIKNKTIKKAVESTENTMEIAKNTEIPENLEKQMVLEKTVISEYSKLYSKLIKKYNITHELTPNELLKFIRQQNLSIYYDLKKITNIHEKTIYGKEVLDENAIKNFYNLIENVMEKL